MKIKEYFEQNTDKNECAVKPETVKPETAKPETVK